jgi:hypothetical protein
LIIAMRLGSLPSSIPVNIGAMALADREPWIIESHH